MSDSCPGLSCSTHNINFIIELFQMIYGIGYEYASLPGAWWLHMIILVVMMITLAYLEVRVGG